MNNKKTNLIAIDIARAIAALGVFFYHQHIGVLLVQYTKIEIFNTIDTFGALYAVPLFFLISGYCIHLSNLKYIKLNEDLPLMAYYKRRFLRIYPPYLFALVTSVALNRISDFRSIPSFWNSVVHLFCLQGFTRYFSSINLVLWTITVEIAFYIIYPLFYYLRLKYSLNLALIFTFFISAISIIYFSLQKNISYPQFYWVGNIWFSWCCGAFVADKLFFDPKALNTPLFKVIYISIVALFIGFVFFKLSYSIIGYQLKILVWTGPLVYLLSLENWLGRQKSVILHILVCIGLSSYSLYLLHEPLIVFKNYFVHTFIPARFQLPALVIGVIIIPLIAWFNYCFVEKPFMGKRKTVKPFVQNIAGSK